MGITAEPLMRGSGSPAWTHKVPSFMLIVSRGCFTTAIEISEVMCVAANEWVRCPRSKENRVESLQRCDGLRATRRATSDTESHTICCDGRGQQKCKPSHAGSQGFARSCSYRNSRLTRNKAGASVNMLRMWIGLALHRFQDGSGDGAPWQLPEPGAVWRELTAPL